MQDCSRIGVGKWQRRNARLNDAISRECANGVSNKQNAQKYRMNASTVERQLHRNHEQLLREQLTYPCPMVMGIDEHSIHRGRTKGAKFAVTLTDLRHRRVYEIFEDKNSKTLEANLRRLKGRENVKVVCMDLSSPLRNLMQRLFPNAKIVADRFHVIPQTESENNLGRFLLCIDFRHLRPLRHCSLARPRIALPGAKRPQKAKKPKQP